MLRKITLIVLAAGLTLAISAGERGTKEEAAAMVSRGLQVLEKQGPDELIRLVNLREAPFTDRDLYLFVIGPDETLVAHGFDESRIGISAKDLYDSEGQPYGSLMLKYADADGKWLRYRAYDPITGRPANKTSLVRRSGDYILGCGIYD